MSIAAASTASLSTDWEQEIRQLLEELSAAQDELLAILREKRGLLSSGNRPGLASIHRRALALGGRLENCIQRRAELLQRVRREESPLGMLLENELLSEWAHAQRLVLEVSQSLESIAVSRSTDGPANAPLSRQFSPLSGTE